jgi:hypothetical protein
VENVLEERKGENIQFFLYHLFFERMRQKEIDRYRFGGMQERFDLIMPPARRGDASRVR